MDKRQYLSSSKNLIEGLSVEVGNNFEKSLRQFIKKVNNSGKLREVRERQEYKKPSIERKERKKQAIKRWHKYLQENTIIKSSDT